MPKQNTRLVIEHARMWPREVFDITDGKYIALRKTETLNKSGVYVLYRDDQPHYIGKATSSLYKRLHDHANKSTDRYFNLWNYFSAFVVPKSQIAAVEGILIAAIPTANSSIPRIKQIPMPGVLRRKLRHARQRIYADK